MTPQIKQHLTAGEHMSKKDIMLGNFLGGLSWGFGTVIGATVMVALLVSTLKGIGLFDAFKDFLNGAQVAPTAVERQITK